MRSVSLSRFPIDEQWQQHAIPSDLRLRVEVVSRAAIKAISINVGKGALAGVLGDAGSGNVQGEAQKKLDVIMYEANPMAMIVEQAGGGATTGRERILDAQPDALHQRIAVFLGSKNEVDRVLGFHQAQ